MVDETPLIGDEGRGNIKRGHGFCCDSKRGTIIVNAIAIVLTALGMISLAVAYNDPNLEEKVVDQEAIDLFNKYYTPIMVVSGIAIVIKIIAIFGASIYNIYMVLLGAVYIIVAVITELVVVPLSNPGTQYLHWYDFVGTIVWTVFVLYWHFLFISEVKKGIMSPQTYPREKHSCCCGV